MNKPMFAHYADAIRQFSGNCLDESLVMDQDGPVSIHYAPFDYTNTEAKVVIVGITPGKTQMANGNPPGQ